jgi:hypothetical protein
MPVNGEGQPGQTSADPYRSICARQRDDTQRADRRDCALIYAGGRSGKVGACDPGMAYDELLAGRVRDCLREVAGVGRNHG